MHKEVRNQKGVNSTLFSEPKKRKENCLKEFRPKNEEKMEDKIFNKKKVIAVGYSHIMLLLGFFY